MTEEKPEKTTHGIQEQEQVQETPEIEPGTPNEYAEFLIKNENFSFSYILKMLREEGSKPPYEDYANEWRDNPVKAADYIEKYFPDGKGKKEFVEALRKPQTIPETESPDPDFDNAYKILLQVIDQLVKRESFYQTAKQERMGSMEKESAVSDTLKTSLGNLVDNFRNGSAMDKAITIAAIGIGIKILMTLKDKKFPFAKEGFTWWSAGKWVLGAWAVNEVSRKVSKDGKSLLQRVTKMGLPVENLQTCVWGAFAFDGKKEAQEITDPNETKQMLMFADKDMKAILKVYGKYPAERRDKFTAEDLEDMGFSPEEIKRLDGKTAFKIVDKLVKRAGRNYFTRLRQQKIEAGQIEEAPPKDFGDNGIMAIKEKYTEGELASHRWTFEEIMTEEYIEVSRDEKMVDELYADYEKAKLPAKVRNAVVQVVATLKGIGKGVTAKKEATETEKAKEKGMEIGKTLKENFNAATDAVKKLIRRILGLKNDEDFLEELKQADDNVKKEIRDLLKKRGVSTSTTPPPEVSTSTTPPPPSTTEKI